MARSKREMLAEYDFSKGVRGKNAKRYKQGSNVVVIDADIAEYFPDHDAVNESLRSLVPLLKRQQARKRITAHKRGRGKGVTKAA